ncbi:hypothetical protein F5B22DRAFT_476089 [Xylaria bambusicola]|uniref:uncharacterized protein n=1 Tax=Xylaria bambusicola TaxID=326684 RepID=UPI002007F284|nr:uncharacterized protein F5B22DRAFT_476089 [Xylaria bambusicola]KAI0506176.1 hypothetical protein F5B22DRAFT_476089 [Xylaria bambusicola]
MSEYLPPDSGPVTFVRDTRDTNHTTKQQSLIACDGCRLAKARCDGQKPSCKNCCEKGIQPCVYTAGPRGGNKLLSPEKAQIQKQGEMHYPHGQLRFEPLNRASGRTPLPELPPHGIRRLQNYVVTGNAPVADMGPHQLWEGSSAAARAGYAPVPLMLRDHTPMNAPRQPMGPPDYIPAARPSVPLIVIDDDDDDDPGWAAWVEQLCASDGWDDMRPTSRRRVE